MRRPGAERERRVMPEPGDSRTQVGPNWTRRASRRSAKEHPSMSEHQTTERSGARRILTRRDLL